MLFSLASPLETVASLGDRVLLILKYVFTSKITYSTAWLRGERKVCDKLGQEAALGGVWAGGRECGYQSTLGVSCRPRTNFIPYMQIPVLRHYKNSHFSSVKKMRVTTGVHRSPCPVPRLHHFRLFTNADRTVRAAFKRGGTQRVG